MNSHSNTCDAPCAYPYAGRYYSLFYNDYAFVHMHLLGRRDDVVTDLRPGSGFATAQLCMGIHSRVCQVTRTLSG